MSVLTGILAWLRGTADRARAKPVEQSNAVETEWRLFFKTGGKTSHWGEVERSWPARVPIIVGHGVCGVHIAHPDLTAPMPESVTLCRRCAKRYMETM